VFVLTGGAAEVVAEAAPLAEELVRLCIYRVREIRCGGVSEGNLFRQDEIVYLSS
jgi:hypothetical protein